MCPAMLYNDVPFIGLPPSECLAVNYYVVRGTECRCCIACTTRYYTHLSDAVCLRSNQALVLTDARTDTSAARHISSEVIS